MVHHRYIRMFTRCLQDVYTMFTRCSLTRSLALAFLRVLPLTLRPSNRRTTGKFYYVKKEKDGMQVRAYTALMYAVLTFYGRDAGRCCIAFLSAGGRGGSEWAGVNHSTHQLTMTHAHPQTQPPPLSTSPIRPPTRSNLPIYSPSDPLTHSLTNFVRPDPPLAAVRSICSATQANSPTRQFSVLRSACTSCATCCSPQ
jgi:hypothetical protein